MAEYITTPILQIDDTPEKQPLSKEGVRAENRAIDISANTGISSSTIMEQDNQDEVVAEYKSRYPEEIQRQIDKSYQTQLPPDEAAVRLSRTAQEIAASMAYDDTYIDSSLNIEHADYDPKAVQTMINYRILGEKLQEATQSEWAEASYVGIAADFLTAIAKSIVYTDFVEAFSDVGGDRGQEVLSIMELPPKQMEEALGKWLEDNAGSNIFERFQVYSDALNKGFDPDKDSRQFWARFGVASTVGTVATKAIGVASRFGKGAEAWQNLRKAETGIPTSAVHESMPDTLKAVTKIETPTPNLSAMNLFEEQNSLIKAVKAREAAVFKGEATAEELKGVAEAAAAEFGNRFNGQLKTFKIPEIGEREMTMILNKPDGSAWNAWSFARAEAERYQDLGYAAKEVEIDGKWFVEVRQNLDLSGVAPAEEIGKAGNVISNLFGKYLGSTRLGGKAGHILALKSNYVLKGHIHEIKKYLEPMNKLSEDEFQVMSRIYDDLRDGADSMHKAGYTKAEFANKWQQRTGSPVPRDEVWDAFNGLRTVEDASYWMDANIMLRKFVGEGYQAIEVGGKRVSAKPVKLEEIKGSQVFDGRSNKLMLTNSKEFAKKMERETQIWEILERDAAKDSVRYVVSPKNVDTMKFSDALSYNAGGRRAYKEADYFITNGEGTGKAFMVAATDKQASIARAELQAIQKAYRQTGAESINNLTNELDEVIKANSTWNTSIENTADFRRFLEQNGLDINTPFDFKRKGGVVQSNVNVYNGMDYNSYFLHQNSRADKPLLAFGGVKPALDSGIKSIFEGIQNSAYNYAYSDAAQRMKTGWLKAFDPNVKISAMGPDHMFREAGEFLKRTKRDKTQEQLLNEWHNISRRLGVKDEITNRAYNLGNDLREFVHDLTGVNVKTGPLEDKLNMLGFSSQFGFLNTPQFLVQASMIPSLGAIAGKSGLKGAAYAIPLRFALHHGSPKRIQKLAKGLGISEDETKAVLEYFHNFRPGDVLQDSIDKNTPAGLGFMKAGQEATPSKLRRTLHKTQRVASKANQIGLTPYAEGERLMTYGGHLTANLEWIKANPGKSLRSQEAIDWIMARGSDLTQNMNTGARSAFQQGIWKVPTQWLSFSFRVAESMITDKVFTKAERARLGMYLLASSGTSVLGLNAMSEYAAEMFGAEPDDAWYTTIKYGMFDGIMSYAFSEMTGEQVQTAVGQRIAPFSGITDLIEKLGEEDPVTIAFGPSGNIIGGGATAVLRSIGNFANGFPHAGTRDLERAIRSLGGVNNAAVIRGILMNDAVYSREGIDLGIETNKWQALLKGMGIPAQNEVELYALRESGYLAAEEVRKYQKDIEKDWGRAIQQLDQGNDEGFSDMTNEIAARIELLPISGYDKQKMRESIMKRSPALNRAYFNYVVRGMDYDASRLSNLAKKDD